MTRADATARVLAALKTGGPTSRAALARATGLADSTVSVTVGELVTEGVLVEDVPAPVPGRTGRPPVLVRLHRSAGLVLGIDLGKSHLRVAVADLGHEVLSERTVDTVEDLPADAQISQVVALADELVAEAGATRAQVVSAAVGLPGPVRRLSGELGDGTILPGWVGVRAAEAMEAALRLPVAVANDADLGALGEWTWGAARGAETAVYLKISTGVGAGLIVAGRPFTGVGGTAGEIGHTVLDPSGARCRCGNHGCLETLAGSQAVLRAVATARGGEAGLREIIAAAHEGDTVSRTAIAASGRAVGLALATLCNLLNPERVVVGGTLGAAGEPLLGPLQDALEEAALRGPLEDVEVVPGQLAERAEVLGAVALALRGARPLRREPTARSALVHGAG